MFNKRQHMEKGFFEIFRYRDSYLNEVELHHHDFYEIYLFLNGNVDYSVENRIYHLESGDILLISPMELHRPIITQAKKPYERIVLWVQPDFLQHYSTVHTNLARCFDAHEPFHTNLLRPREDMRENINSLMQSLVFESSNTTYGSDLSCISSLLNLLVLINRLAAFDSRHVSPENKSEIIVSEVIKYISLHYCENITLDNLAAQFFVSKYHLSHQFNRIVGTSIYRYIIQKRLIIAKQLLNDGVLPTRACEKCGFTDYANFYRAFKAEYGISPKIYFNT